MSRGILSKLVFLFILTQVLGVFVAYQYNIQHPGTIEPASVSDFDIWNAVLLVGMFTLVTVVAIKYRRFAGWMFSVFLLFFIFLGTQTILEVWLSWQHALPISIGLALLTRLFRNVLLQNLGMVIALSGIGALLGLSLEPIVAVLALVILSFYDIFAVYRSGHMVKMAESMVASRSIFGFVVPERMEQMKTKMRSVSIGKGSGFMILGSGDVVLPLLLASSVIPHSLTDGIVITVFGFLGLLLMYYIFTHQKVRRPMAALPPIAMMSIVGYLITTFI